jgi:hypothetical protein
MGELRSRARILAPNPEENFPFLRCRCIWEEKLKWI